MLDVRTLVPRCRENQMTGLEATGEKPARRHLTRFNLNVSVRFVSTSIFGRTNRSAPHTFIVYNTVPVHRRAFSF